MILDISNSYFVKFFSLVDSELARNAKKICENIWMVKRDALLLHPLSRTKGTDNGPGGARKKKIEKTSKKVWRIREKVLTFAPATEKKEAR